MDAKLHEANRSAHAVADAALAYRKFVSDTARRVKTCQSQLEVHTLMAVYKTDADRFTAELEEALDRYQAVLQGEVD